MSAAAAARDTRTILVTGARGFLGRNLRCGLDQRLTAGATAAAPAPRWQVLEYNRSDSCSGDTDLEDLCARADVVVHLAGVNRPPREDEFEAINVGLTRRLCEALRAADRQATLLYPSSIHAGADTPYGRSKRRAEELVEAYCQATGAAGWLCRLPGVFGKWCRPNYNSVVATYCFNSARGLPLEVHDPDRQLELVYVDHVVAALLAACGAGAAQGSPTTQGSLTTPSRGLTRSEISPLFRLRLGELAERISALQQHRLSGRIPDLSDELNRCLHATFTAYLDPQALRQDVRLISDQRGWLFELLKSDGAGQVFVSRTAPGVTRGNHYHNSKVEKFCVVQGRGLIRFRAVHSHEVIEVPVDDERIAIVDIPPGTTHSIENTGSSEMITLFWASEIFDPRRPDTTAAPVLLGRAQGGGP